jgi:hypothetical protein
VLVFVRKKKNIAELLLIFIFLKLTAESESLGPPLTEEDEHYLPRREKNYLKNLSKGKRECSGNQRFALVLNGERNRNQSNK